MYKRPGFDHRHEVALAGDLSRHPLGITESGEMYRQFSVFVKSFSRLQITPNKLVRHEVVHPEGKNIWGISHVRCYKSEFNLEWTPPPPVKCTDVIKSGDLSPYPEVDLNRPLLRGDKLDQLSNVSPEVRKLVSLEFAPQKKQFQVVKHDIISGVRRHNMDSSSMETQIASLTARIRNRQKFLKKQEKNVFYRVSLKEAIERRQKLLKHLRRMDYKKFEWLLEKLDLVYHSLPYPLTRITRKDSLQKLTSHYCKTLREQRLEAYRKELEEQKASFHQEKQTLLQWIEKEERELGIKS